MAIREVSELFRVSSEQQPVLNWPDELGIPTPSKSADNTLRGTEVAQQTRLDAGCRLLRRAFLRLLNLENDQSLILLTIA